MESECAKAGGNINQRAKWCNKNQNDVAPGDAQRLSENRKIMQKELQKRWQQVEVSRTTSCSRAMNYAETRATINTGINCDVDYDKSEKKQIRMLDG
ncbi:plasmid mobilization relaxosome protein MobC, partial [Enterococcus faecium]